RAQALSAWLLEQVEKLCGRSKEYGAAYAHPGGHRTSNMLDRVMRGMSRYFEDGQHLHGSGAACGRHVRAWALLQNFRPWGPEAGGGQGGLAKPGGAAHRAPLPRGLAPEPTDLCLSGWLPPVIHPAPNFGTVSV